MLKAINAQEDREVTDILGQGAKEKETLSYYNFTASNGDHLDPTYH